MDVEQGGLNREQRLAVQTGSGPLMVLAGAGTGKTRVVTYRIAALIRSGTAADRILAVTFTNKAAREMQQRVALLLGRRLKERPVVATFHAHCVQILRRHIRQLGYPQRFAIYARGDQESVARTVLREIHVPRETLRPSELLQCISRWKTASVPPAQAAAAAGSDKEHLAAAAYRRYQQTLKSRGAVDFDDLLLCTEQLFQQSRAVLREEAARFDHLLVDEYQDTNQSQYRITKALAAGHRNLCVVGDDDQSIYGWRGAEVAHILRFTRDWPDAQVVRLEQNYRSTAEILDMANRLIAFNKLRHPKRLLAARPGGQKPRVEQFQDETQEARGVVADVARQLSKPGFEPRDFAILFRTNEQPRAFETELRAAGLPYVLIGGMSFFDRREVRDVLAYLQVLDAPNDEVALRRIVNTPPRGISTSVVERLTAAAVAQGASLWDVMQQAPQLSALPENAGQAVLRLTRLVAGFRRRLANKTSLVKLARNLLAQIDYEAELRRVCADASEQQSRWAAVEEVINALGAYEARARRPTLRGFLDDTLLGAQDFDNEKEKQLDRNAVALMTIHSAKGLEFPHVYLVGMEEGILPHRRSLELSDAAAVDEERRLCYVGVTRAQERLTLSLALTRRKWGKPRETAASRFLFELTGMADNPHTGPRAPKNQGTAAPQRTTARGPGAKSAGAPQTKGRRRKRR